MNYFRWILALIFAACSIYSFAAGRTGFGWFYTAMCAVFFLSALLTRRPRAR